MSRQVLSYGFMACLLTPVSPAEAQDINERLDKNHSPLKVNYEGTLVYCDSGRHGDDHGAHLVLSSAGHLTEFALELARNSITITHEVSFYSCSWYDGVDSSMDTLTLKEFLKRSQE